MTPEDLSKLLEVDLHELKLAGEQSLSRDDTAKGYALESLEHIAGRLDEQGDVADVLPEQGGTVQHLQWALGVFFVAPATERERIEVVSGRFLELDDGELLVSGRERPAVLRVLTAGVPSWAYVLAHGRAEVWSFARAAPPDDALHFAVPDLHELTRAVAGSPDVESEFLLLRESPSSLDRLASVGLVLRFWVPCDGVARKQLLAELAMKESPLMARIRTWWLSLAESTRNAIDRLAGAEVDELRRMLSELEVTHEATALYELATRTALHRDRLESVRRVLIATGTGDALTSAVRSLDDFAALHLTQLADAGVSDERLRRVLLSEPDAWWAIIGE